MMRFIKWLGFHVHDWSQWSHSGVGRHLIKSDATTFDISGGVGYTEDRYLTAADIHGELRDGHFRGYPQEFERFGIVPTHGVLRSDSGHAHLRCALRHEVRVGLQHGEPAAGSREHGEKIREIVPWKFRFGEAHSPGR